MENNLFYALEESIPCLISSSCKLFFNHDILNRLMLRLTSLIVVSFVEEFIESSVIDSVVGVILREILIRCSPLLTKKYFCSYWTSIFPILKCK